MKRELSDCELELVSGGGLFELQRVDGTGGLVDVGAKEPGGKDLPREDPKDPGSGR